MNGRSLDVGKKRPEKKKNRYPTSHPVGREPANRARLRHAVACEGAPSLYFVDGNSRSGTIIVLSLPIDDNGDGDGGNDGGAGRFLSLSRSP